MVAELHRASPILVTAQGILPTDTVAVIHQHLRPILGAAAAHSRVRITRLVEPTLTRPIVAQVDIQLAGHRIRAQVTASTAPDAVDRLAARTIDQLRLIPRALADCLRDRATNHSQPSFPELLPPGERRIARRKTSAPVTMSVREAIAQLQAMDYRFHLFRERYSRQEAVVLRNVSGGYRILQTRPNPIGLEVATPPLVLAAAERLTLAEAIDRLDLTGAPVVVFAIRTTGRLHALYSRYDGNYGLLGPTPFSRESVRR
ncbi:sigma 54 modulation/S30EA ribosomal C-terminal domain-containing protein [Kribbella speibonae]|nr:sigma 54 modulation/S30EA ribosomal C-terminal domain-containing protein [Kribbella speibonae]